MTAPAGGAGPVDRPNAGRATTAGGGGSTGGGLGFAPGQVLSGPVDLRLSASVVGSEVHYLPSVGSTNTALRSMAERGAPEGTVVLADEQTAGRGRSGRPWHSPSRGGLWFSVLFTPRKPARELTPFSLVTAVSVVTVLRRDFGVGARVKWPNDVWVDRLKLCGILLESLQNAAGEVGHLVVGIGLNVNLDAADLPPEMEGRATSIKMLLGRPVPALEVLRSVLDGLDDDWRTFGEEGFAAFRERWRALSATLGKRVEIAPDATNGDLGERRIAGRAVDVSEDGALVVETDAGERVEVWHGDLLMLD